MTRTLFSVSCLLLLVGLAGAGELPAADAGLIVKADILSREGEHVLYAIGNVFLQRGDSTVSADAAVVWITEQEAYLEGHVVYRFGQSVIKSERAYLHWDKVTDAGGKTSTTIDRGFLFRGDIRWNERPDGLPWHVRGNEILQTDVRTFIARGSPFFSTNLYHKPHTYFKANEIELVGDESISADHVTYNIQGVSLPPNCQGWWLPPFYIPRLYIPLGYNQPEMKFLFGNSDKYGTFVQTLTTYELPPGTIPIVESSVGFRFDYMADRGIGYGGLFDYRYEDALAGNLDYYRVPSDDGMDREDYELGETDRWRFKYTHSQDIPEGWEFDIEFHALSDAGFRQEYFTREYRSEKPVENRVYLKWSRGALGAYVHVRKQSEDWYDTTEHLPQVGVNVLSYPIWGPLLYTGHAEVTHVKRRLSELRLPYDYIFENPGTIGMDDDDDDEDEGFDDEGYDTDAAIVSPNAIKDRDDIVDGGYVDDALDANFSQRPLRSTYQEALSDGESLWRYGMYHELAAPFEVGILHFDPYVGVRSNYYSESLDSDSDWNHLTVAGVRVATQFWQAWNNASADSLFGIIPLEVDGLRHIITPEFRALTIGSSGLEPIERVLIDDTDVNQPTANPGYDVPFRPYQPWDTTGLAFGDVDLIHPVTVFSLGFRNRWQTLREDVTGESRVVDLLDIDIFLNHFTHDDREVLEAPDWMRPAVEDDDPMPTGEDFTDLRVDLRFNPITGVYYFADATLAITNDDSDDSTMERFNQGLLIATSERWRLYLSHRYEVDEETRLGGQLFYVIDPKWRVMIGYSHRTGSSDPVEAEIRLIRDLHDWVAEFVFEDDMEENSQFVGIQLRPKMLQQLVGDVEYEREFSEGLDAEMGENFQQYDY